LEFFSQRPEFSRCNIKSVVIVENPYGKMTVEKRKRKKKKGGGRGRSRGGMPR